MENICDSYPVNRGIVFTVGTSPKISDWPMEDYNAVLNFNKLVEYTDSVVWLDNDALYDIC